MMKLRLWWNFRPLKRMKESVLRDIRHGANILLIGKPGTGKTFFMKEVGSKHIRDPYYLYCNAAVDGIQLSRLSRMIRDFCKIPLDGRKTIFVDDLDAAKDDTQQFIKTMMDGKNVSFIFAANSIERISQAIRSRCVTYRFDVPDGRTDIEREEQRLDEFTRSVIRQKMMGER